MKHILITGGSGFIGKATMHNLLEEGFTVTNIDLISPDFTHPNLKYLQADIRNIEEIEKAFEGVDYVLHAAAMSRSGPSNALWRECISSNINGTANVLECASRFNIQNFVYCGSSTYYGNQAGPHRETLPPDLLNFYGATKYAGEELVRQYGNAFGLNTSILRYFNVYGPGQPISGSYALVMGIFLNAYKRKESVIIDGDGLQTRDFIHLSDVTLANKNALLNPTEGVTMNIGSGKDTSILTLARMFNLEYSFGPKRSGDAKTTLADISNAKKYLDWSPTISIEEGVKSLLS